MCVCFFFTPNVFDGEPAWVFRTAACFFERLAMSPLISPKGPARSGLGCECGVCCCFGA